MAKGLNPLLKIKNGQLTLVEVGKFPKLRDSRRIIAGLPCRKAGLVQAQLLSRVGHTETSATPRPDQQLRLDQRPYSFGHSSLSGVATCHGADAILNRRACSRNRVVKPGVCAGCSDRWRDPGVQLSNRWI